MADILVDFVSEKAEEVGEKLVEKSEEALTENPIETLIDNAGDAIIETTEDVLDDIIMSEEQHRQEQQMSLVPVQPKPLQNTVPQMVPQIPPPVAVQNIITLSQPTPAPVAPVVPTVIEMKRRGQPPPACCALCLSICCCLICPCICLSLPALILSAMSLTDNADRRYRAARCKVNSSFALQGTMLLLAIIAGVGVVVYIKVILPEITDTYNQIIENREEKREREKAEREKEAVTESRDYSDKTGRPYYNNYITIIPGKAYNRQSWEGESVLGSGRPSLGGGG